MKDGAQPLRLYTLYGPPEHRDGTVQPTNADVVERKRAIRSEAS